ncbi:RNA-dependent RNA polymerase, partial [Lasius niger]
MTDGEIQQMRRLTDTAKHQSKELEIFNLDLSKWNLRFRHALVAPFGRCFDTMLYPPKYNESTLEPIPGKHFYIGHLGGMEGMRQKLWTIITICLIKLAAERSNLAIDIMCQGDNQVVMIRYKPNQILKKIEIRGRFLTNLSEILQSVNLSLKLEETWFSIRLCEFGKVRFFDGEAISSGTKKIYRMVPEINDGVCSIMSSLSTINTITEALAKFDFTPDSAFIINQFHILNYLHRKKILLPNQNKVEWVKYLFHPSDFGGTTLSTYYSHFVRGNDDKLPVWLGIFQTAKRNYAELFRRIISINQLSPNTGEPNLRKLVEDIFSLNIYNLSSIENMFKSLALKHITSENVTNKEVRKLFESDTAYTIDNLLKKVATMNPMIPSIAHEILRNSNAGILLALRTRFTNIQTINKIVQAQFHQDFLNLMKRNNEKIVKILKDFCSNVELENSITIQLSYDYTNLKVGKYLKDGPYIAYLGSATREKVKKPTLEMSTKTSYIKALQQLVLLKTWLKRLGSENLVILLDELIDEKIVIREEEEEDPEHEDWCGMNYGVKITEVKFDILPHQAGLPKSPVEIENGLIQETSYTIHELISFLSITLGRQF